MKLHLLGINHKTAPVEIREKVAITPLMLRDALSFFLSRNNSKRIVILSTCNRTEIYSETSSLEGSLGFLENYFKMKAPEIKKYLYNYSGQKTIEHLMRVASGLDSMIIGEGQILGQVKEAWKAAQEVDSTSSLLNSAFNRAISCGKRSRTETKISRGAVSIGSAAAELARKIFGNLTLRQVLIVGAGKMSEVAARQIRAKTIFVSNRTFSHAKKLASLVKGKAVRFDVLDDYLKTCDIVIASTGAPHYIIDRSKVQKIINSRKSNPLFLIDIAVPRNIDPRAGEIDNVNLYDIDDLKAIAAENLKERQAEIPKVEEIINEEVVKFLEWRKKAPGSRAIEYA